MEPIDKRKIQTIYAKSRKLGICTANTEDDELHTLIYGLTGKEHIRDLTDRDFRLVMDELDKRSAPLSVNITESQERYIWRLMYTLIEFDGPHPPAKEIRKRLIGALSKATGKTINERDIFAGFTKNDARKAIEQLKRYIATAQRKKAGDAGG